MVGGVNDPVTFSAYVRYIGTNAQVDYTLRIGFYNGTTLVNNVNTPVTIKSGDWMRMVNELAYADGPYTSVGYWLYYTGAGGNPATTGSYLDLTGTQFEHGPLSDLIIGSFDPIP